MFFPGSVELLKEGLIGFLLVEPAPVSEEFVAHYGLLFAAISRDRRIKRDYL